jgi:hypothetical protein
MHTETMPNATMTSRLARIYRAVLRAIVPRWMQEDDPDMPTHRRMGAWEADISQSARDAVSRMRRRLP